MAGSRDDDRRSWDAWRDGPLGSMSHKRQPKAPSESAIHAKTLLERVRREQAEDEKAAREVLLRVREAVFDLGPRFGISRAIIIGSLVWRGFDPERSDVDLMVFGLESGRAVELAASLWDRLDRPVHVIRAESAAQSLISRALASGEELHVT